MRCVAVLVLLFAVGVALPAHSADRNRAMTLTTLLTKLEPGGMPQNYSPKPSADAIMACYSRGDSCNFDSDCCRGLTCSFDSASQKRACH